MRFQFIILFIFCFVKISFAAAPCDSLVANINVSGSTQLCEGDAVTLSGDAGLQYLWSTGATTQSITVSVGGFYSLIVTDATGCQSYPNSEFVSVLPIEAPSVTAFGPLDFCGDTSLILIADYDNAQYSFEWNTGAIGDTLEVFNTGTYFGITSNLFNCELTSDTFVVTSASNNLAQINVNGNQTICNGETTILAASAADNYLWSNGSTQQTIVVANAGIYTLTTWDNSGCDSLMDEIEIFEENLDPIELVPDAPPIFCLGSSIYLNVNLPFWYQITWMDGNTSFDTTITQSGNYWLSAFDSITGCSVNSDTLEVVVGIPSVPFLTTIGDTILCENEDSVTLISSPSFAYYWNTMSIEQEISVDEPGAYFVTTFDEFGCILNSDTVNIYKDLPIETPNINGEIWVNPYEPNTYITNAGNDIDFFWEVNGGIVNQIDNDTIVVLWQNDYDDKTLCITWVSAYGCHQEQTCVNINFGVNAEDVATQSFKMYPSIVSDFIFIENLTTSFAQEKIEIYNSVGTLKISQSLNSSSAKIDLSKLNAGQYFVKINQQIERIIKL